MPASPAFLLAFQVSVHPVILPFSQVVKVVRNKKLKILSIDNLFSCHLMVMKLCTVMELGNISGSFNEGIRIKHFW